MKIIKYGNDEGIVFNNGNSLWDTYSQSCCEYNYAEWDQLEPSALNYDFMKKVFNWCQMIMVSDLEIKTEHSLFLVTRNKMESIVIG